MGNEAMFVLEVKNDSLERVEALKEEIKQNELVIKCCDDIANKGIVNPLTIKKIKYDATIAKNAAENSDVANPEDKERAEKDIEKASAELVAIQQNLEQILKNLEYVNSDNLIESKNDLVKYVNESLESGAEYINYSRDVLSGNYHDFVEKEKEEEVAPVIEEPQEVNEVVEEEVPEEKVEEEEVNKVEAVEPFVPSNEFKAEVEENVNDMITPVEETSIVDTVEPVEAVETVNDFDDISKQLDQELDAALKPVEDDIQNLHSDLDATAPISIDDPLLTTLSDVTEPSELIVDQVADNHEEIEPVVTDEIVSAANVDEGAVKVVKVEEVGAPEESIENEQGFGRSLAA